MQKAERIPCRSRHARTRRVQYDSVLRDAATRVAFPYSGFGSLVVRGERWADCGVSVANRILAFLPERCHRAVPVPLRKLDFFEDYAILWDHNRKIEILIDHQLLPIRSVYESAVRTMPEMPAESRSHSAASWARAMRQAFVSK